MRRCIYARDRAELKDAILSLRLDFRVWPRKLLAKLRPSPGRAGRRPRRSATFSSRSDSFTGQAPAPSVDQRRPFAAITAANDEWATDFKGWFRTLNGRRVDPLTITDSYSRFLIDVRAARPTIEGVQPIFTAAFRLYGLPRAIRCDNGTPFGSIGAGGLTRLSVWWLKLGIEPHFIHPASPQENGRHERMHRTLQEQTARPPAANAATQQASFDAFRKHYNEERPHEALGQRPPGEFYVPSPRSMPDWTEPCYDEDHQVRRVNSNGEIKWRGGRIFISTALIGELVGIAELETGDHVVRFCELDVGLIDIRGRFCRSLRLVTGSANRQNQKTVGNHAGPKCRQSCRLNLGAWRAPLTRPHRGEDAARRSTSPRERGEVGVRCTVVHQIHRDLLECPAFRSSHHSAARSFANFGIEGH